MIGGRGADAGRVLSVHRKLMPTYEERLSWATGDGAGLVTHRMDEFTVGALNCWENWMPLARAALYGQGENLRIALWPGGEHNTRDITPVLAKEGRSFVISASSVLRAGDVASDVGPLAMGIADASEWLCDGGSCIAGPDGSWVVPPVVREERVIVADIDLGRVLEERQNFDPSGHYARPDVLRLSVVRERQTSVRFQDGA
jgi:nitrilase